ncbi:MAG: SH3 domain-containing protein, partial [Candidatus Shapirobacteria bacterium]|nr:SH3 domain-containing protein [Candidatus Shapirobacteria bacterium]
DVYKRQVSYLLINSYHQKRISDMAKPGDLGLVQGESTEITPEPSKDETNNSPLIIDKPSGYPIYRTPNLDSDIVYTAQENEKFNVISDQGDWYQVSLGNGSGGWLKKSNVKSSQ